MIQIIKQAAIEAVEQSSPMTIAYGTVTKTNPLEINVEQKLPLTKDFIVNTKTFNMATFEIGDKLILLRVQGGQEYIYIDKLVM